MSERGEGMSQQLRSVWRLFWSQQHQNCVGGSGDGNHQMEQNHWLQSETGAPKTSSNSSPLRAVEGGFQPQSSGLGHHGKNS